MQKPGSAYLQYKDEIEKYGKGLKNINGDILLQLAKEKNLILTNTLFDHKLAHPTTWTAKDQPNEPHHYGDTICKNPYRNQIDYITKQIQKKLITNARSYGGFSTSTDHTLVITNIKFLWSKINQHKAINKQLNI